MKIILGYLKPYRGIAAAALIIKFIGSVAELFLPMLLEYIIDDAVAAGDVKLIVWLGVAMLVCSAAALSGNIIANRLSVRASGRMTHDLRYDLFKKTSYLNCPQVDKFGNPSLISRLTSDTYYVNQMVARTMRLGVRAPILIIGTLIFTFVLDAWLALVLTCAIPIVCIALYFITKKSVPMYSVVQRSGDDVVRCMQENASGVRVVKALSKSDYEAEKFTSVADKLAKNEFKANRIMSLSNPLATLILNIGLVALIVVGAIKGTDAGVLLAFLTFFTIILNALLGLSKIFVIISRGAASCSRIEKVLIEDCTQPVGEYPGGDEDYKIQFKDVSFSYNGVEDNLKDINFCLKKGQTLGIIGATGSGKTTVINLLMRFYDVDKGQVLIDGTDVRSYPAENLRAKFGVAFQSDFIMGATVRENIDYGRNLPDEDIERAIDAAQAREFIDGLEDRTLHTLAQKGSDLSGGQKQRLLIARALAGNPEILVLDDSSSALDYATDAALRKRLAQEYAEVTKIIVAQRISSIQSADLILVLEEGEVIGSGTHERLLSDCEEYRLIFDTQMGGDLGEAGGVCNAAQN